MVSVNFLLAKISSQEKFLVSKILICEKKFVSKNVYALFCLLWLIKLHNKFQLSMTFPWGKLFGRVIVVDVVTEQNKVNSRLFLGWSLTKKNSQWIQKNPFLWLRLKVSQIFQFEPHPFTFLFYICIFLYFEKSGYCQNPNLTTTQP